MAYEPNNEASAVAEYQKWCTKLVEHDWPFCFGVPKEQQQPKVLEQGEQFKVVEEQKLDEHQKSIKEQQKSMEDQEDTNSTGHYHTPISHPEDFELDQHQKLDTITEEDRKMDYMDTMSEDTEKLASSDTFMDAMNDFPEEEEDLVEQDVNTMTIQLNTHVVIDQLNSPSSSSSTTTTTPPPPPSSLSQQQQQASTSSSSPAPTTPKTSSKKKESIPSEPFIPLDQLDLSNIPQSWHDIVYVAPSLIPGGGNGLFAKRNLPYNTPIGFYFGVPMTEDEFDSTKDRVGRASEYSIMYRRTVLDATDASGQPITDPTSTRYCPFHFMNETNSQKTASVAFVEGAIVNQIICWTKKDIPQDEELLVWYGKDVHRYWTEEEEEANKLQEQQEKLSYRKVKNKKQSSERALLLEQKKQQKELEKVQRVQREELKKIQRAQEKKQKKKQAEEEQLAKAFKEREEQRLELEAVEAERRANEVGQMFGEQIMTLDQLHVTKEEEANVSRRMLTQQEQNELNSKFVFKEYHPRTNKKRRTSSSLSVKTVKAETVVAVNSSSKKEKEEMVVPGTSVMDLSHLMDMDQEQPTADHVLSINEILTASTDQ